MKKADLFECIQNMPAHFDSYKVLDGAIGDFITVARASGDAWFVGSLTNRDARQLEIRFDFLDEGKRYKATFYEDDQDTHYLDNKESYRVRQGISVDKNTTLKVDLAPGGGHSIWIKAS